MGTDAGTTPTEVKPASVAEGGPTSYTPTPNVPVRKHRRDREGKSKERDGRAHKSRDRSKKHRKSKSRKRETNVLDDFAKPAARKKEDPDIGNLEESKFN
jgi:hypothetical protein